MSPLPIEPILRDLRRALEEGRGAVVTAPPGAGKTTLVPPALLDVPWLGGRRIIMLEPRRLAARAAAHRMASLRGEAVGQTVGYRIRLDTRVGPQTRIEVVTEGVLTRLVQHDPSLAGYGLVIFDEFHERSLHADLGLALCLEARRLFRPDLRLLVMSATLDAAVVARLLGEAPVLSCEGRQYPVETRYAERPLPVDRNFRFPFSTSQPPLYLLWSSHDVGYPVPGLVSTLFHHMYSVPWRSVQMFLQAMLQVWHPMHLSR